MEKWLVEWLGFSLLETCCETAKRKKKTRSKNPETTWLQERLHRGDHRRVQHPPAWLDFCRLPPSWALTPWAFSFNLRQLSVTQNEKAVQVLRHGPQFYMAIFGVLKIYRDLWKYRKQVYTCILYMLTYTHNARQYNQHTNIYTLKRKTWTTNLRRPWVLPNHGGSSMNGSNLVEQHGTDVQAGCHGSHHVRDYDLEIDDVGYQWGLGVQGGDCRQRLCGDHDGRGGVCDGQCGACDGRDGRDGLCGACQHGACRRGGCQNGAGRGACRRGDRGAGDQGDCGACHGGDQDGDALAGACGACARACGDLVHDLHVEPSGRLWCSTWDIWFQPNRVAALATTRHFESMESRRRPELHPLFKLCWLGSGGPSDVRHWHHLPLQWDSVRTEGINFKLQSVPPKRPKRQKLIQSQPVRS